MRGPEDPRSGFDLSRMEFEFPPGGDFGEPAWDILLQGHETRRGGRVDLGPGGHALHEDLVLFRRKHCSGPAKLQLDTAMVIDRGHESL